MDGVTIGIVVGLGCLVLLGFWLLRRMRQRGLVTEAELAPHKESCQHGGGAGCCGGTNCLKKQIAEHIIYFEDEELDAYRSRTEGSYSEAEVVDFREVLTTLRDEEVQPWLRSLRLRRIALPLELQAEAQRRIDA